MWKMLGDLGGVFWSYGEPPSSHIIKNPKNGPKNIQNTILPYVSVYYELPIDRTAAVMLDHIGVRDA